MKRNSRRTRGDLQTSTEDAQRDPYFPELVLMEGYPRLRSVAHVSSGIEYTPYSHEHNVPPAPFDPPDGFVSGLVHASEDIEPFFVSRHSYEHIPLDVLTHQSHHLPWQKPKVILKMRLRDAGVWPLVAVPDFGGIVASKSFLAVWPKADELTIEVLAALLNGHVANGFVSTVDGEYDQATMIESLPLPELTPQIVNRLTDLVSRYRVERIEVEATGSEQAAGACRRLLLEIDSVTLHGYGLPRDVQTKLLSRFAGSVRPGLERITGHGLISDAASLNRPEDPAFAPLPSEEDLARIDAELAGESLPALALFRQRHPELLDERGELDYARAVERLELPEDGTKILTRDEVIALRPAKGFRQTEDGT